MLYQNGGFYKKQHAKKTQKMKIKCSTTADISKEAKKLHPSLDLTGKALVNPYCLKSFKKILSKLNFYFQTSLWQLQRFYEGPYGL